MCMGLDSMERAHFGPHQKSTLDPLTELEDNSLQTNCGNQGNASDEIHDSPFSTNNQRHSAGSVVIYPQPKCRDGSWNNSIYQLLVFETVLACLKQKCSFRWIRFQDPHFTATDIQFLKRKGYEVIPHNLNKGWTYESVCDSRIMKCVSDSTFVYAPYLAQIEAIYELVCFRKPAIYLGPDIGSPRAPWYIVSGQLVCAYHILH